MLSLPDALPIWFGITVKTDTPARGLVLSSVLVSILIMMNFTRTMADLFTFMALLSTAATLVLYLTCAAASLRLTATGEMPRSVPFLIVAGLGLVYARSEEHTSELQSLMRISYAVFCLQKKTHKST